MILGIRDIIIVILLIYILCSNIHVNEEYSIPSKCLSADNMLRTNYSCRTMLDTLVTIYKKKHNL